MSSETERQVGMRLGRLSLAHVSSLELSHETGIGRSRAVVVSRQDGPHNAYGKRVFLPCLRRVTWRE